MARHSRLKSSTMHRMRKRRPSLSVSETKSSDQRWLIVMRQHHRRPRSQRPLAAAAPAHHQLLLAVQPIELLAIHRVSFARQQPAQTPVAEAPPLLRPARADADAVQNRPRAWADSAESNGRSPPACMRVADSTRAARSAGSPRRAAPQASDVFSEQVLKRRVIQHRFGQQLLQPPVLILQRLQPPRLRDLQPAVLRFPLNGMDGFLSPIAKMTNNAIEREVSNESSHTRYRPGKECLPAPRCRP